MTTTPETRYVRGGAGLIAYQVMGEGPVDLVYITGAASHVDVRWDSPSFVEFFERLGSFSRLIMLDRRGAGASDRLPADAPATWEEWTEDLLVVLDAVGSERAAVVAVLDAGPMAMLFTAMHPERVVALVLGNTSARVLADEDFPEGMPREAVDGLVDAIEQGWGTEDFARYVAPSLADDPARCAWFAKFTRASMTPSAAADQYRSMLEVDVRWVLPSIRVPTLVAHRRDFFVGREHGRYLQEHIPGARFVELPGADSLISGQAAGVVLDAIEELVTGQVPRHADSRVLATVLFNDIVGSTEQAARLGDLRWRGLLDEQDAVVRRHLDRFGGTLVKTTGDGSLATFDGPARAVRCAVAIRDDLARIGLDVRSGLHTGEIELRGADVAGIGVVIAQRVSSLAGGGEVLVSSTVKDLVLGSQLGFVDRGEHPLKGVPGPWRLYAVDG